VVGLALVGERVERRRGKMEKGGSGVSVLLGVVKIEEVIKGRGSLKTSWGRDGRESGGVFRSRQVFIPYPQRG